LNHIKIFLDNTKNYLITNLKKISLTFKKMYNEILTQFIGFIGLFFVVIAFQINDRKKILYLMLVAVCFYTFHYILLKALTGVVINIVSFFRTYVFSQRFDKKWANKKIWLYLFLCFYVIFGLISLKTPYDSFAIIGACTMTFGVWSKNPRHIRYITILSMPFWAGYNVINSSIAGVVTVAFIFVSTIIGIYRFDKEYYYNKFLVKKP
jgi:inner membrane protein